MACFSARTDQTQTDTAWWDARPAKPGRPLSIDVHAHWAPEAYINAVHEYGHMVEIHPMYSDLDKRIKWMDEHGVQMHVLSLDGSAPSAWASAEQGMRLARIANDAAIEAHTAFPDRIIAAIAAPVRDPALTLQELNRLEGKPGMKAFHLPDSINGHDYLFQPDFAPVLARCEEPAYPLIFHQIGSDGSNRNDRTAGPPRLTAALDAPYDHAVIATKFITTGTLDKFPELEIVLPHGGGDFPWLAGRVEHFLYPYYLDRGPVVNLAHPFRDYLRRFHYDYLNLLSRGLSVLAELSRARAHPGGHGQFCGHGRAISQRGPRSIQSSRRGSESHPLRQRQAAFSSELAIRPIARGKPISKFAALSMLSRAPCLEIGVRTWDKGLWTALRRVRVIGIVCSVQAVICTRRIRNAAVPVPSNGCGAVRTRHSELEIHRTRKHARWQLSS